VDDKTKGPAKTSFHVSVKNGLVAVEEVVVPGNEKHTSVPSHLEFQTEQYKHPKSQLGNSRQVSKDGLENLSLLTGSYPSGGNGDDEDDQSSEYPRSDHYQHRDKHQCKFF
jgi:hypothetical protein